VAAEKRVPIEARDQLSDEKILGGLEVEAFLRLGREHLFLLFTQKRMLLAHHAKTGAGSIVLSSMLGKMAGGFRRGSAKAEALRKIAEMDPTRILELHPENFAVDYSRVVTMRVEHESAGGRSKITLVTSEGKYELYASPVAVEGIREDVLSLLQGKAEYREQKM